MSRHSRKCTDCGAPVEGRPNKIFCNSVCKGRHFRSTTYTEPMNEDIESRGIMQPEPFRQLSATKFMEEDDEEQEEAADKARQYQQQASNLHIQFVALVREVLESAGTTLNARRLRSLLSDAARLSAAYATHPYIKASHTQVKPRLKALYAINDIFQEMAEEIGNKMRGERQEGIFEISKKWRKHLRELLIED